MDQHDIRVLIDQYLRDEQDEHFCTEIRNLVAAENWPELTDRFYTNLAFGTGGLRGVIGGGFNRMNPLVIRRVTQGLANYILRHAPDPDNKSVAIAYDSRHYSALFSLQAALTLCANGIRVYLYQGLRSTPQLSFTVRKLGATAGIVVTASHNPPQYNGYKVYWADGAQIIAPHDEAIVAEVAAFSGTPPILDESAALAQGLLSYIGPELDDQFIAMVKQQSLRPQLLAQKGGSVSVVLTPLHGTGGVPVSRALTEMGVRVHIVPEQEQPDGNFPTVTYPNPEEAAAMQMAVELAKEIKADLVLGTDPDADRLGVGVRQGSEYRLLTGNQLGALLADYIFSSRRELGTLPDKPAFVKTIVTTNLQRAIASSFGAECFDVLTGFKYIGEKIGQFEHQGIGYVFGGEESYGYLVETQVRDKDAVSAATMSVEMALYWLSQGKSLADRLGDLYLKFGYFEELLISKNFPGMAGVATIEQMMQRVRSNPPRTFGKQGVATVKDYLSRTTLDLGTGITTANIDLPSANVLQLVLTDGSIVTLRPSGTEPKIKFYASCCEKPGMDLQAAQVSVAAKLAAIRSDLAGLSA